LLLHSAAMVLLIARSFVALFVISSLAWAGPAQAHDYWLRLDSDLAVQPGTDVDVRMWVGDKLGRGEEDEYRARKVKSFVHLSASGSENLKGRTREGATPTISLSQLSPGGHLVAMTRGKNHITLPGWKFSTYLFAEGFKGVSEARKESGTTWSAGKERYSRYLKTLIQVGRPADSIYGTVLGQKYEIVLLNDPMAMVAGESLSVLVLFGGKPAQGMRVVAKSAEHDGAEGRTDPSGVVKLPLSGRGEWLIRSVHMRACDGCKKADWESFWAAYHFIQF